MQNLSSHRSRLFDHATNACPHGKLDGVGNNKGDHRKRQRRRHVQLGDNHQLHRTACIGNKQHRDISDKNPGKTRDLARKRLGKRARYRGAQQKAPQSRP